jgi:hypothetical protein
MAQQRPTDPEMPADGVGITTWILIGGLLLILAFGIYLATRGGGDQDKLSNPQVASGETPSKEKICASKSTYDAIKRDLFRRAAQLRGSDQAAYDQLAAAAVLRMENPVMESEDSTTGAVNCSGSLSLDLPPGVAVAGGRRTLSSNVDYSVQPAADGTGPVVLLRNADAIVTPLATLTRTALPPAAPEPVETNDVASPDDGPDSEAATPSPPQQSGVSRPSFDCGSARTRGEIAVCGDSGLAALDLNMASQYRRALVSAAPDERALLQSTRDRFLRYRDRCGDRQCIADAYVGRMREIRDISEGNWQPPR